MVKSTSNLWYNSVIENALSVVFTPTEQVAKRSLATVITLTKVCNRCKSEKSVSEFYVRSGCDNPTDIGHYISECKACMQDRAKSRKPLSATEPRTATEILAIEYLKSQGIPALPGKAISFAHVDVVAFGCIEIEVKYARLETKRGVQKFTFNSTPAQSRHGYRGSIVMLICEYPNERYTYHLFDAKHPVFYMDGRIKTGFTFTPGAIEALKHGNNRVVMTQPLMDAHQDNIELILEKLASYSSQLKTV